MKVDMSSFISAFNDFFTSAYKAKIDSLLLVYPTHKSLYIDYSDFEKYDPDLADHLVKEPDVVIESAEEALRMLNLSVPAGETFSPHVRFVNVPADNLLVEQIGSRSLNQLVSFKCVITKRAEVMHRVKMAVYRCQLCDGEMRLPVSKNFTPPKRCESCKKLALEQVEDESEYVDIQRAESQELLERTKGGAPAAHIELLLTDDIVNRIAPGDNVTVVGVLRLKPPTKPRQKQDFIYSRYVDCSSVTSLKRDFEELEITKEEEVQFKELSKRPDIIEIVVNSIAPSIYGHSEVKRAIALQLFGGTRGKTLSGGMNIRDDIHILLIGDPGIAKCVRGDSEVLLSDGSLIPIKELVDEALQDNKNEDDDGFYSFSKRDVVSMNLDGRSSDKKATVFWKLKSPDCLYRIETESGKKIVVTPTHPFFSTKDAQIFSKPASKLSKRDFIASPHRIRIKGEYQQLPSVRHGKTNSNLPTLPNVLDGNFARLLGYLAGDGYFRRTTSYEISLTNADTELISDFKQILENFGLPCRLREKNQGFGKKKFALQFQPGIYPIPNIGSQFSGSSDVNKLSVECESDEDSQTTINATSFSVDLGLVIKKIGGITGNSFTKFVPSAIMRSPDDVVREFIKAYFDCEAHVSKEGLTVVSASEKMLRQVQILLLRFGILSQVHETYSRATNAKNHPKTKYSRLFVCGDNARRYFDSIAFVSSRKNSLSSKLPAESNTNIDVVPGLSKILKRIRCTLGISQFQCGIPRTTYQHFERGDRNPSYSTLKKVVFAFKKRAKKLVELPTEVSVELKRLADLSSSDIFWDRITIVERIKSQDQWVYDLQVDDVHNFVAAGIFVHNSRFLQSLLEIAPKSIYVSGKSVSGAGLCVAGDSLITLNDRGIHEIKEFVENNFKGEGVEEIRGAFSSKHDSKIASVSSNFNTDYNSSRKIWRIKPPKKMVHITTRRGKELKLTPNTKLITIVDGVPQWIKSSEIKEFDFIATSKSIKPLEGKTIPLIDLIKNPNVRVISKDFKQITDKLAKKYGSLEAVAKRYGLDRERLYINRCMKQGVRLEMIKQMALDAGIQPQSIPIEIIFLRHGLEHKLPRRLSPEICYLAGLVAGDGDINLSHKEQGASSFVRFHSVDKGLIKRFSQIIRSDFALKTKIVRGGERIPCIMTNSVVLAEILASLGVPAGEKSHKLDIPPLLTSASKECVSAYLRGLFDTDGWVYGRLAGKGSSSVGFCTCSKKLTMKVQLLLEWWGIISRIRSRKDKIGKISFIAGNRVETKREQFYLEITGIENIRAFQRYVGFERKDKKEKLDKLVSNFQNRSNPNLDILPVLALLKKLKKKYGLKIDNKTGRTFFHRSNPSQKKLIHIMQIIPDCPEKEILEALVSSNLYWDTIKSVALEKPQDKWVYDLTVDGTHNFLANGIVVHNTVAAEKDELGEGGWTLKAGALVLASGGMAQIDEFDKISEEDLGALHEAMESQTVSVAKAGIVAKFRTKTAILAAANPKYGRFDTSKNLSDQFEIPPTLLSRFDLIFPIVDVLDAEKDARLADHILATHMGKEEAQPTETFDRDLLRKYIAFARRKCNPKLQQAASNRIKNFYVDLRSRGKESGSVPITPRYLEGLVRLAEAHAKVRMSSTVEEEDSDVAIGLFNYVMHQIMTDKETGLMDVDVVATGKPKSVREKAQRADTVLDIIRDLLRKNDTAEAELVIAEAAKAEIDEPMARKILTELLKNGTLWEKHYGHYRITGE